MQLVNVVFELGYNNPSHNQPDYHISRNYTVEKKRADQGEKIVLVQFKKPQVHSDK